ncbi:MAG: type II secretion system protein [Rickettsiales bacterium]|nr:type II secretion system protein [Rickettsiales bacterium]
MRKAITLVELTIVILIISLLSALINGALGIIKSAKTRDYINNIREYENSYYSFYSIYSGFPGDLSNASYFWPTSLNGNGDSIIKYEVGDASEEFANAWVHLALGDFVMTPYGPLEFPTSNNDLVSYVLRYYDNLYNLMGNSITLQSPAFAGVLTPVEAYQLDCKIDNCEPDVGEMVIINGNGVTASETSCLNETNKLNTKNVVTSECRAVMFFD